MKDRILLAIDQFEPGQAAVDFTIRIATKSKADVLVFHVREVPSSLGIAPLESPGEAQELVGLAVQRLLAAGIAAEGDTCSDHVSCVARLIVNEATGRHCDAIILGSLRRRGIQSVMGHRTRERVLKMSPLPVLVTPPARRVSGRKMADR